ncbi:toxin-antitoxin system YwqK family antitoxin [Carboxylicivirga taeanensis]|uniref:toxin-antitoxin system YwqK family antitoxin n=1 Tax=Carboxylicivirga taeanensis TaxID=1416875 RepID=UPI003F6DFE8E
MKDIYFLFLLVSLSCSKNQKEYYHDGNLKAEYMINDNGEYHGKYKEFYNNGKTKTLIDFENGYKSGVAEFYDSTGQLAAKEYFQHGEIKYVKEFTTDGKIAYEFNFLDTLNLPTIEDFNIQLSNKQTFLTVGDTTQIDVSCNSLSKNNLRVIITNGMHKINWQKDSFLYSFVPKQVGKSKVMIYVNADNRSKKHYYIGFKEYEIKN